MSAIRESPNLGRSFQPPIAYFFFLRAGFAFFLDFFLGAGA